MLKKFLIREPGQLPVGELIYDTDLQEFTLTVYDTETAHIPAFMYFMCRFGMTTVRGDLAMCFVHERLVPPDRANISQILADLKLPYYDEVLLLEAMHGRCVMDDFLVEPTYQPEVYTNV